MLLWRVPKKNTGFTLFEMLATVIVVGVIAAVAAPNLIGLLNRNRVNEAITQIEGAIKEAQKQAVRDGSSCTITINNSSDGNDTDNGISGGCLLSDRSLDDRIDFNSSRTTLTFSGKGNITIDPANGLPTPVFVVFMSNGTNQQKCLVIENSLGIVRTGDYLGTPPASPIAANCQ